MSNKIEYWTARIICRRMGWRSENTLRNQVERNGFLAFQRRRPGYSRPVWFTNEALISSWMLLQCREEQMRLRARRRQ